MVHIIVVSVLGMLLGGCSNSSRMEDILRANSRPQSTMQPLPKSRLNNNGMPEAETHVVPDAPPPPEEPRTSPVRSLTEE
jgi:hypothetical protein